MKKRKLSQELNGNNKRENFKEEKCFHCCFTGYHYLEVWYEVIHLDIHHIQIYDKINQNIITFINVI
jgi:hypothetical protein